nr:MAG TPA: hypothetical protein [Bacteriophage sp.]
MIKQRLPYLLKKRGCSYFFKTNVMPLINYARKYSKTITFLLLYTI